MIISTMKDDDYTREGISMMVNWTNKFSKDKTTIKSYRVYISTSPEGMTMGSIVDKSFLKANN